MPRKTGRIIRSGNDFTVPIGLRLPVTFAVCLVQTSAGSGMEVRRLLTALYIVWKDFNDLKILPKLNELDEAAQALVSTADASTSDAFYSAVTDLKSTLPNASANLAAGSLRLALNEAGADSLVGDVLLAKLNAIFQSEPFLPARAAQSIRELVKQISADYKRTGDALTALEALNFKQDIIPASQYEIGVLMPSKITKDDLRAIDKELHSWVRVIDHIQELVDGLPSDKIPIRSMSSGSLDFFCAFHATGACAFLIMSGMVYAIFQIVRDAQKRRSEMEQLPYPKELILQLIEHEKNLIEKGKNDIVDKLMEQKSAAIDKHRKEELRNWLTHDIAFVLERVNDGVDVEVSTPPEAEAVRDDAATEVARLKQQIEDMRTKMTKIQASLPDRTSGPLLALPEPLAEDVEDETPPPPLPEELEQMAEVVPKSLPVSKPAGRKRRPKPDTE